MNQCRYFEFLEIVVSSEPAADDPSWRQHAPPSVSCGDPFTVLTGDPFTVLTDEVPSLPESLVKSEALGCQVLAPLFPAAIFNTQSFCVVRTYCLVNISRFLEDLYRIPSFVAAIFLEL